MGVKLSSFKNEKFTLVENIMYDTIVGGYCSFGLSMVETAFYVVNNAFTSSKPTGNSRFRATAIE